MTTTDNNVANPLLKRLLAASTTKRATTVEKSTLLNKKDFIPTDIPALNIAFSGSLEGGLIPGFTMIAGPSKHFKSLLMMLAMKAYLDKYPTAIAYLYDSEFGTPKSYFEAVGIDMSRVIHSPIVNIEELTFDIVAILEAIQRDDKVFLGIDSIGNLASKKEADDAKDGKSVADMTRAKKLKGLFRIITPYLTILDIPLIAVNHTYKELSLFPKQIVGGGQGAYYSADNIWIIGRQQSKNGKDLKGYHFIINVEKSRFLKENSKIPLTVLFDKGVYKWSALLDIALEYNFIVKPKLGWYALSDPKTGEILSEKNVREKDTGPILETLMSNKDFQESVRNKYQLASGDLITEESSIDEENEDDA